MVLTLVTTAGVMVMMNLQRKDAGRLQDATRVAEAKGAAK
jgi:hypothetical protein